MALSASLELMGKDLARARPFEEGADYADVLDATNVIKKDGSLDPLPDVAHVGVSPGPRSVVGLESAARLIGMLQPFLATSRRPRSWS